MRFPVLGMDLFNVVASARDWLLSWARPTLQAWVRQALEGCRGSGRRHWCTCA